MEVCMACVQSIQLHEEITCGCAAPVQLLVSMRNLRALTGVLLNGVTKETWISSRPKCARFTWTCMYVQYRHSHVPMSMWYQFHMLHAHVCAKHQYTLKWIKQEHCLSNWILQDAVLIPCRLAMLRVHTSESWLTSLQLPIHIRWYASAEHCQSKVESLVRQKHIARSDVQGWCMPSNMTSHTCQDRTH